MPITTNDFAHLTDDLQEIFNEAASTSIAEMVGNQIFDVKMTDRQTYDYLVLHGISAIQSVAQGQDFPAATLVEGDSITWTQQQYAGLVPVTKRMRMFDLYDQIESLVRSITDEAFHKIDQSMADVLLNGFSASNYTDVYGDSVSAVGPDGLALFTASHSNNINSTVFSNLIKDENATTNPALDREAVVQAMIDARVYRDPQGLNRPVRLDTLLVSPSNEDLARRIVDSDRVSGSAENDVNTLRGKLKVVVWEKLETRSDGTDTSDYWFMYDSRKVKETLKALFAEKPTLDAPEQVYKNKNWEYTLDYFYSLGRGYAAFLRGSTGANG